MKNVIYALTSPSGRTYIGQAKDLEGRFSDHVRTARLKNGKNFLYRAIRKYGFDAFQKHVLVVDADRHWRNFYEMMFIHIFDTFKSKQGYNCNIGGSGVVGMKHTKELSGKMYARMR